MEAPAEMTKGMEERSICSPPMTRLMTMWPMVANRRMRGKSVAGSLTLRKVMELVSASVGKKQRQ